MNIETKYNIGDTVYYPDYGKVYKGRIVSIEISYITTEDNSRSKREIKYGVYPLEINTYVISTTRNEEGLYTNREDVVKLLAERKTGEIGMRRSDLDVLILFKEKLDEYITNHPRYKKENLKSN